MRGTNVPLRSQKRHADKSERTGRAVLGGIYVTTLVLAVALVVVALYYGSSVWLAAIALATGVAFALALLISVILPASR